MFIRKNFHTFNQPILPTPIPLLMVYYKLGNYMWIQKLFLLGCFLLLISESVFAVNVTQEPTIDFGSVGYLAGSVTGFASIVVPSEGGQTTTSGTGSLTGEPVGSAGTVGLEPGALEWIVILFGGSIQLRTNGSSTPATITGPGNCGVISIGDFRTTGNGTSASAREASTFPLGATLTLNSFTGSSGCTISGTVSNHVQYKLSSSSNWTNLPVTITVYIAPHMSVAHDANAVLNFGNICQSGSQQTVTVRPDGTATSTNAQCPVTNVSADSFTVTGNVGQSFSVSLPSSFSINSGNNDLSVTALTPSCATSCALTNSTYTFTVGGTLTVPANAVAGDYTGTYQVTITY